MNPCFYFSLIKSAIQIKMMLLEEKHCTGWSVLGSDMKYSMFVGLRLDLEMQPDLLLYSNKDPIVSG